jgi:hypothetical protein
MAIVVGFAFLLRYASARGVDPRAPVAWPSNIALPLHYDRPTLFMFVHPRCACSRASLRELANLVSRVRGKVAPVVVFVKPNGAGADFAGTELRALAARVEGVTLVDDDGGALAGRFGVETSGTCLLYDASGRLEFQGGVTDLRGHEGRSFGQERLVSLITSGHADRNDSPVFGCPVGDTPGKEGRQ